MRLSLKISGRLSEIVSGYMGLLGMISLALAVS